MVDLSKPKLHTVWKCRNGRLAELTSVNPTGQCPIWFRFRDAGDGFDGYSFTTRDDGTQYGRKVHSEIDIVEEVRPVRVQRRRTKGFRLESPNGLPVVCVTRPGVYGNPFPWTAAREAGYCGTEEQLKEFSVDVFRQWLTNNARYGHGKEQERIRLRNRLHLLRNCNLACWCGPDDPCHADVLLELANAAFSPLH